jgi:hypothetical protein
MVDLEGTCIVKASNSGMLIVIEIYLSPTTPPQEIEKIKGFVAASSHSSANVQPTTLVKLTPVDPKTDKPSLLASLGVTLGVWVLIAELAFYVSGTAKHLIEFIELYQQHIQETQMNGSAVPIDQAKQAIKNAELSQPTPKNEHHEKSGNPPAISSEGD